MTAYEEIAGLVTSELVTNAVEASTDEQGHPVYINGHMAIVIFRVLATRDGLVLEAWDLAPSVPIVRNATTYDEHGRGLFLIQTLSYQWDWKVVPDWPGKCVWAEIRLLLHSLRRHPPKVSTAAWARRGWEGAGMAGFVG